MENRFLENIERTPGITTYPQPNLTICSVICVVKQIPSSQSESFQSNITNQKITQLLDEGSLLLKRKFDDGSLNYGVRFDINLISLRGIFTLLNLLQITNFLFGVSDRQIRYGKK
ncbi:52cec553-4880-4c0a-bfdc-3fad3910a626 [Sclerotinia trifoliorum]|uniref:52cec553-4880-4c0a-bfdc-3fad3910a626 n=1 Tax=Sclerotinia trifoliorum TaxID=28548 RepID=A0A8H2W0Y3_9HELO|nr:52cec553-4880-4c0a-bfdc-3fad3910a626 [Sclerotinia trifoliorum]